MKEFCIQWHMKLSFHFQMGPVSQPAQKTSSSFLSEQQVLQPGNTGEPGPESQIKGDMFTSGALT